jgi:hypothetical protein
MAITAKPADSAAEPLPHQVLRPIFVGGARREVGDVVMFTRSQGNELIVAGKLRRLDAAEATAHAKAAAARAEKAAKADDKPEGEGGK